jgi:hypothetical protein
MLLLLLTRTWFNSSLVYVLIPESTNGDNSAAVTPSARLQILRTTRLLFGPAAAGPGSSADGDEPGARVRDLLRLCIAPPDDLQCNFNPPKWPMECQVSRLHTCVFVFIVVGS